MLKPFQTYFQNTHTHTKVKKTLKNSTKLHKTPGLKVVMSSNIFSENLHTANSLSTSHYLTKRPFDFFFFRSSGIRLNIGVSHSHVIPTFSDVSSKGDNDFVFSNVRMNNITPLFRNITQHFCRFAFVVIILGLSSNNAIIFFFFSIFFKINSMFDHNSVYYFVKISFSNISS